MIFNGLMGELMRMEDMEMVSRIRVMLGRWKIGRIMEQIEIYI